jgi:hypothetical protein
MNNEMIGKWAPGARSERDAIGAGLRRICDGRKDQLTSEMRSLLEKLDAPTARAPAGRPSSSG